MSYMELWAQIQVYGMIAGYALLVVVAIVWFLSWLTGGKRKK